MTTLQKSRKRRLLLLIPAVLLCLAAAPTVFADDDDDDGGGSRVANRCVVKFVCGEVLPPNGTFPFRAVTGVYRSAINILNAGTETVDYSKKLALTTPCEEVDPETPGSTLGPIAGSLDMMSAFDVDCGEIFEEFGAGACNGGLTFVEGFLILESDGPLDVTAVYTAGPSDVAGVNSIDVEAVECGGGGGGDDDDDGDD